jgi:hypothetical protein
MNGRIIISISIVIAIVAVIFTLNETDESQISQISNVNTNKINADEVLQSNNPTQVEKILDKIKEDKVENENDASPYLYWEYPREWISTGPVEIDYSEYLLGQKIFINIHEFNPNEKGKVKFFRPLNNTHHEMYFEIPFDDSGKRNNFYLTPELSAVKGICNKDQLIGEWKILLEGTNYPILNFEVIDRIMPGNTDRYMPIVDQFECK